MHVGIKKRTTLFLCFVFLFMGMASSAQRLAVDTLLNYLKTDKTDTNHLIHLSKLASDYSWLYMGDSTRYYVDKARKLCFQLDTGNQKIGWRVQKTRAALFNTMGNLFYDEGNYPEALKNHFASLRIRDQQNDTKGKAASYNNIGLVYGFQSNYEEALKNYAICLKLYQQVGDEAGVASTYNNVAIVYSDQGKYDEALKNHFASLELKKKLNRDPTDIAASYNNIGLIYYYLGQLDKAMENYKEVEKIYQTKPDKAGWAIIWYNIGNVYGKRGQFKECKEYLIRSRDISLEIDYKQNLRGVYAALVEVEEELGNYKAAFENHQLFVACKDSIDNEETRLQTIQNQLNYDFEKKEAVATAEHKKELENQEVLSEEKSRKQQLVLLFVASSLLLVLCFAVFIFRSLRITKKQKRLIEMQKGIVEDQKREVELQKNIVEEHQQSIIDSITYARRIQRSLLPTEKYIERTLARLKKRA